MVRPGGRVSWLGLRFLRRLLLAGAVERDRLALRPGGRVSWLGLRFLRRLLLAGAVERDRLADQRLEGGRVDFFALVNVDRAAGVSLETGVEEPGRVFQRRAFGEGELDGLLVGFAGADDAVVRPDWY